MQTKEINLYIGSGFKPYVMTWRWTNTKVGAMKNYWHPTAASIIRILAIQAHIEHIEGDNESPSFVAIVARVEKEN